MLITAIVMVVVLAVALTTSSLAWFSATQSNVTASGGSFTASTATGSGVNIAISKSLEGFSNSVELDKASKTQAMLPLCLNTALTTSLAEDDPIVKFDTAEVNNAFFQKKSIQSYDFKLDYVNTISETGENKVAVTPKNTSKPFYYDAIYLVNYDQSNELRSISLSLDCTLSKGSNTDNLAFPVAMIRISRSGTGKNEWTEVEHFVLVLDTKNSGTYTIHDLRSLKTNESVKDYSDELLTSKALPVNYDVEPVTVDETSKIFVENISIDFTNNGADNGLAVAGGEFAKIDILMWFDGNGLNASSQQTIANFNIKIDGPDNA